MRGFGFEMFGIGMLLMVLFWVVVIGTAVWLVMTLVRGSQGQSVPRVLASSPLPGQTPLEILQACYAKGEITKKQFEEMRRHLSV